MLSILDTGSLAQVIFFYCALGGGSFFCFQLVLTFLGFGDLGDSELGDTSGELDFRFLSLQGLSAFLMIFGLSALAFNIEAGFATAPSALLASVCGWAAGFSLKKLFSLFHKLRSSGTLNFKNAITEVGEVYLTIPKGGFGKVRISIQGRLKVLNAKANDDASFSYGDKVIVVDVDNQYNLIVQSFQE